MRRARDPSSGAEDFPRDPAAFEHNLERLFARAYSPVVVRPAFRHTIVDLWVETFARERTAATRRPAPAGDRGRRLLLPVLALAAAAVALFLGRELLFPTTPHAPASANSFLEAGRVAIASGNGPWNAASRSQLDFGIELGSDRLRLAVPAGSHLTLHAADGTLRVGPASDPGEDTRASFTGGPLRGTLAAGGLLLERHAGEVAGEAWTIEVGPGELALAQGRLRARVAGEDAELLLERGVSWYRGPAGRIELRPGERLALRRGRPLRGTADTAPRAEPAAPDAMASARLPVETPVPAAAEPGVSLSGIVTGPDGSPLRSFQLALLRERQGNEYEGPSRLDVSSADGRFRWNDLDSGSYTLFVFAADLAPTTVGPLDLGAGEHDIEGAIRLEVGGSIRGFVSDARDSSPIVGAVLLSEETAPQNFLPLSGLDASFVPVRTTTREDGSFLLEHLPPGPHHLRVTASGFGPTWSHSIVVENGRETRDASLTLAPGGAVRGTVLGDHGVPVPGALLIVTPLNRSDHRQVHFAQTRTETDGTYLVSDLPPIPMLVVLVEVDHSPIPRVRPTRIRAGRTGVVDFMLDATASSLSGVLRSADGTPVPDRNLALFPSGATNDFRNFEATTTDEDGRFRFEGVAPGAHLLYAVGTDGLWIRLLGSATVTTEEGPPLELTLSGSSLSGRVLDGPTGETPPPTELSLLRLDPDSGSSVFAGSLHTGSDGSFLVEDLPSGTYRVLARPNSEERGGVMSAPIPLDALTPNQNLTLTLRPGGSLEVLVTDDNGRPVPHARISILGSDGTEVTPGDPPRTDANGRYLAVGLAPATYHVHAEPPLGTQSALAGVSADGSTFCRASERTPLHLTLHAALDDANTTKER